MGAFKLPQKAKLFGANKPVGLLGCLNRAGEKLVRFSPGFFSAEKRLFPRFFSWKEKKWLSVFDSFFGYAVNRFSVRQGGRIHEFGYAFVVLGFAQIEPGF